MLMPTGDWSDPMVVSTSSTLTINTTTQLYVAVRAVDTNGNQSANSVVLRVSDQRFMCVANDDMSWYEFDLAYADTLRSSYAKNNGVGYWLSCREVTTNYTNSRVLKSVRVRPYKQSTGVMSTTFANQMPGTMVLGYTVASANAPGAQSVVYGKAGSAPAGNLNKKLALFWNNGAQWIKVGGDINQTAQTMSFTTTRLGEYELRLAPESGDSSLVQVYPKIITPNGDGANDVVIFQFGEGGSVGSMSGEIFDITGAKIAAIQNGPDATTMKWDGKTDGGVVVPSGIYIYQITVNGSRVNGTVVVAR
jgi:gliding motility-associated-like protein